MLKKCFIVVFCFCVSFSVAQSNLLKGNGSVKFISDAPLELIQASSDQLTGILDVDKNAFAFQISVGSFFGFNSPLQQEHFNEHYLETTKYPKATYKGKIIESITWNKNGTYIVRTKGIMQIHGVEKEMVIPIEVKIIDKKIVATANFTALLDDFNINIPKIVKANISQEILVKVNIDFEQKN